MIERPLSFSRSFERGEGNKEKISVLAKELGLTEKQVKENIYGYLEFLKLKEQAAKLN